MTVVKKILIGTGVVLTIIVGGGSAIVYFYEDEIKQYIIAEINKSLETEISVENIELSAFRKFPYISLEFNNVLAKEAIIRVGERDTLFYFKKAYLKFNLIDVIRENYQIKEIDLEEGFLRFEIDEEGIGNYHIFREQGGKSEFLVQLEDVNASKIQISFINELRGDDISLYCKEINLGGAFSQDEFELDIAGATYVQNLIINQINYLSERELHLTTGIKVNKTRNSYTLAKSSVLIDRKHDFKVSGKILDQPAFLSLDLQIKSSELSILSAMTLVPDKYRKEINNYTSTGSLDFQCTIAGKLSKSKVPTVTASFYIKDGTIKQKSSGYALTDVQLTGHFTNGKNQNLSTSVFDIENMTAKLGSGDLQATFRVDHLNHPHLNITLVGDLDLHELHKFIGIDTLETISGRMKLNAKFKGRVKNLQHYTAKELRNGTASGFIELSDVNFRFKNSRLSYRNWSGKLEVYNNDMIIHDLAGNLGNTDLQLDGLFRNMLAFLSIKEEILTVEARLSSKQLDFDTLLASGKSAYTFTFPANINFNLNAKIGWLKFRRFRAEGITGVVQLSSSELAAHKLSLKTMNGSVKGDCRVVPLSDGNFIIASNAVINGIDIQQLFFQFENFGQTVVRHEHLKGIAAAQIKFKGVITPHLHLIPAKTNAIADLTVKDGELIAFEPMNDIADYFKSNKLLRAFVKADELRSKLINIKFSHLSNQVEVRDEQVFIPSMEIHSSALDMEIAGIHTFDNEIDYKLNFYLSDLLTRKSKQPKEDFGFVEDDGLGKTRIFLKMTGTVDNPDITYDKRALLANIKNEKENEKKVIKGMLKEEFGWFRKDTTIAIPDERNAQANFIIEWEEEDQDTNINKKEISGNRLDNQKRNNLNRVLKKLQQEEKEKGSAEFEFEDYY